MRTRRTIVGVVLLATCGLSLTACNVGADASKGLGDSSVNQQTIDRSAANVIEFSDKYPDIEFKCHGTDGVYTNTRSAGYFVVIANDKSCAG